MQVLNRPATRDTGVYRHGRPVMKLTEDLVFKVQLNGDQGIRVRVPIGFETDLTSTPRMFWPIFPPAGPWSPAAILHDYLYGLPGCSRFLADALFREAMQKLGVPWWRRVVMYYAVRIFARRHKTTRKGSRKGAKAQRKE